MERDRPFKRISWQRSAARLLPVLGSYFDTAKQKVEQNEEHLYCINDYAICLLRGEGSELVVVGFSGRGLLAECAPLITRKAIERGFTSIRVHTKRKGECRFLNKHGLPFVLVEHRSCGEYVLKLELVNNGR
ncbi:hypothetical protein K2C01_003862 [Vibrio vulnificus]|uniref:hypothetical protein n=1 Tax=Vibrio vulnificus TaxID=672 RepID=UPI00102C826E|nr:hypothetical protein [Vibrio vulnificus]EHY1015184.1 hypothetical protein [Vibrio vulnificus]RZR40882.1 hypothetical protein D8T58_21645 [Vibrio vulnificus]HDY8229139.1 hypothetical protein [Vibrio vulnificus]